MSTVVPEGYQAPQGPGGKVSAAQCPDVQSPARRLALSEERRYLYISRHRLDELRGQSAAGHGRVTGVSAQVLGSGGCIQRGPPDERSKLYREIESVHQHLNKEGTVGTPDAPLKYFFGRLSMFIVPFDEIKPSVLYLVGETQRSVIALAGPLKYMVGLDPGDAKSRDGAKFIHGEPEVVAAIADSLANGDEGRSTPASGRPTGRRWELNVVGTQRRVTHYPQNFEKREVETLAWCDRFSEASSLADAMPDPKNVVLGKPVFIIYV
jgi:uncharacterized protein DUF7019